MTQGIPAGRLVLPAEKVEVEQIFPGLAAQWPGFDLGQAQIAQGERAQRAEQGAGNVFRGKNQRSFPRHASSKRHRMAADVLGTPQEKEPREVLAIVLYRPAQNRSAIRLGGNS